MTDITALAGTVIYAFKSSEEYIEYTESLKALKEEPALYKRVNEMREKNFSLHQSDMESSELMDLMDALTNEYEDVINNEAVARFLEAEAAICRMVREFNLMVTEGLEFD